ncbi:MAG TPA: glycosyltransferase family protein [Kofleriaceae bacterium]|nr:glycosyltransferase family protein [Kofleriaceae bacterium]
MNTVAIVQARMGSTRLRGKVLADLAGDSMLARVIARLRKARTIDEIVVATTSQPDDDRVVAEATRCGIGSYRGSEHDVLERYLGAARAWRATTIVRVTSDCPLLDPSVVDRVVSALPGADYASNTHSRTFPRGLDVEALTIGALEKIGRLGTSQAAREHVTAFVMEKPHLFTIRQVASSTDDSDLRWTVDTGEDLALVRALYARLGLDSKILPYRDIVAEVRANPSLREINGHVAQKPTELDRVA